MADGRWVTMRTAWQQALYGDGGFYRRESPVDHFRTSAHVGPLLAAALAELTRRLGVEAVCDIGAGGGELLAALAACAPELDLAGVELRPRPPLLPGAVGWGSRMPHAHAGLVLAHEWLDNVPCDVVGLAPDGQVRQVEVYIDRREQRLGEPVGEAEAAWLEQWWPLDVPGDRAEIGLARESAWQTVRRANPASWLLAVDFGHLRSARPPGGSLSSYRTGRQTDVRLDGSHDVTAAVAFDSLAAAVDGDVERQRTMLLRLGMSAARPPLDRADADPAGYLRELAAATQAAELVDPAGLGAFYWLMSPPLQDGRGGTGAARP